MQCDQPLPSTMVSLRWQTPLLHRLRLPHFLDFEQKNHLFSWLINTPHCLQYKTNENYEILNTDCLRWSNGPDTLQVLVHRGQHSNNTTPYKSLVVCEPEIALAFTSHPCTPSQVQKEMYSRGESSTLSIKKAWSPVLPTLPCVCAPLIMMGKFKEKTIHHDNRTPLVDWVQDRASFLTVIPTYHAES